jgi:acylaminoacyl-peptidase
VNVIAEEPTFVPLLDHTKIWHWPRAAPIDEVSARVLCARFIDGFGGHDGPVHPAVFIIDLVTLQVSDFREAFEPIDIFGVSWNPFISSQTVVVTQERRCRWFPAAIDLESLESKELCEIAPASAVVEDVRTGAVIVRVASPIETPRFAFFKDGGLTFLTESTRFETHSFELVLNENFNDAILIIAPGDTKKFVVSPHGGPSGMFASYFSRYYAFFYLNGYSLCLVNYRGSTGYPADVQKSLPGRCGELDADDVIWHIDRVRSLFNVTKLGIWGWSHGGFLASTLAGRNPDKIDFAVVGAGCTNFIALYYTSDIADWALVEAGARAEPDGEIDIDETALAALLKVSPVRYVKDVKAPILIVHGRADRRVPLGQGLDYYYALKRHNKPVKLLLYDNVGHSMGAPDVWDDTMVASVAFFEDPVGFIEHDYLAPEEPSKEK